MCVHVHVYMYVCMVRVCVYACVCRCIVRLHNMYVHDVYMCASKGMPKSERGMGVSALAVKFLCLHVQMYVVVLCQ